MMKRVEQCTNRMILPFVLFFLALSLYLDLKLTIIKKKWFNSDANSIVLIQFTTENRHSLSISLQFKSMTILISFFFFIFIFIFGSWYYMFYKCVFSLVSSIKSYGYNGRHWVSLLKQLITT